MSSIMVNDNVIDLIGSPGAKAGDPIDLKSSPQTSYVKFVNHLITSPAGTKPTPSHRISQQIRMVRLGYLSGSLPVGIAPQPAHDCRFPLQQSLPKLVFREALSAAGIQIKNGPAAVTDFLPIRVSIRRRSGSRTRVSSTLEEIKVTLKVSQNLHAGMGPYLLGSLVGKDRKTALDAGFKVEHGFLQSAKLDLSGAAQGDGAGGDWADLFSPDFMVHYLTYWSTRPDYQDFFKALPILGKDGTLAKIQTNSPGAGHVFAKTGTFGSEDRLGGKMMLNGKACRLRTHQKTARDLPSPRTSITSRSHPIRKLRSTWPVKLSEKLLQPPMMPTWKPREERATTISSSATVTSSMARKSLVCG